MPSYSAAMPRRARPAPIAADPIGMTALAAFGLAFALGTALRGIPHWIGWLYVLASVSCFAIYAIDKAAAIGGRRRVSEATLLWLGTLGGWPGAIVAQQVLRHKTIKRSFRLRFWLSVGANVVALTCFEFVLH